MQYQQHQPPGRLVLQTTSVSDGDSTVSTLRLRRRAYLPIGLVRWLLLLLGRLIRRVAGVRRRLRRLRVLGLLGVAGEGRRLLRLRLLWLLRIGAEGRGARRRRRRVRLRGKQDTGVLAIRSARAEAPHCGAINDASCSCSAYTYALFVA